MVDGVGPWRVLAFRYGRLVAFVEEDDVGFSSEGSVETDWFRGSGREDFVAELDVPDAPDDTVAVLFDVIGQLARLRARTPSAIDAVAAFRPDEEDVMTTKYPSICGFGKRAEYILASELLRAFFLVMVTEINGFRFLLDCP